MARAVLMGAPDFFSIRGGANPHTRNRWGRRKKVRRELAIAQWHAFARRLVDEGVHVFVVPADADWPGLVYPANAGSLIPLDDAIPVATKEFVLSNLLPTRRGESPIYRRVLQRLGFSPGSVRARFEGEADFFPVGDDLYLFTFGAVERQRFVPRWGFPPWQRRYGFRSSREALAELAPRLPDREVLPLELRDEAFYHGDTCLAAFGPGRRFVLAWTEALTSPGLEALRQRLGDRMISLDRADAELYAANSFSLETDGRHRLFLPEGVSSRLLDAIRDRGVEPVSIDVSEFWRKGGGSLKCMIGDLGPLDEPATREIAGWRNQYAYVTGDDARAPGQSAGRPP